MVRRVHSVLALMDIAHGTNENRPRGPANRGTRALESRAGLEQDCGRVRQLRSLVVVFALYACVLLFVILFVTDGGYIGSILAGIGGHAVYTSARAAFAWREATWLDSVRGRMLRRRLV